MSHMIYIVLFLFLSTAIVFAVPWRRQDVRKRLRDLAAQPPPAKLAMDAMCYEMAAPRASKP